MLWKLLLVASWPSDVGAVTIGNDNEGEKKGTLYSLVVIVCCPYDIPHTFFFLNHCSSMVDPQTLVMLASCSLSYHDLIFSQPCRVRRFFLFICHCWVDPLCYTSSSHLERLISKQHEPCPPPYWSKEGTWLLSVVVL